MVVTITESSLYTFYATLGYAGLLTLIILGLIAWTPAFTFLKARLTNGWIIFEKLKGLRMVDIKVGKQFGTSAIKTKNGRYFISDESAFMITKGKAKSVLVPSSVGSTVSPDFLALVQTIEKSTGILIKSDADYKEAVKKYQTNYPDAKSIKIRPYTSIKFRDLDKLFERNVNVDIQESAFALERRKASLMDKFNMTHAMILFVILMGVGVAIFLITKSFGQNYCPACNCVLNGLNQTVQAVTGGVVNATG